MKKITILFAVLSLVFSAVNAQSLFEFETAVDNGNNVTETIDGIGVTFTNDIVTDAAGTSVINGSGFGGSTANVVLTGPTTSVTFTFDQPVDVNSILALEGALGSPDYTFTPTGGSNSAVVASLVTGTASVDLNWTDVTSFTVTAASNVTFAFDNLSVSAGSPPATTLFEFETAVDNGNNVTEIIDGITVTFTNDITTDDANTYLIAAGGFGGSTANVVITGPTTSATFAFDQPVAISSILALEGALGNPDYTFTPTGGSNSAVFASLVTGTASVDLNWTDVTSFTVTAASNVTFAFDNLSIDTPLSVSDAYRSEKALVYPNPVENILHVKSILDLKSINVYNSLGQQVLESKQDRFDVSDLSRGMYFLQIHTSQGTETKRIIKK